MNDCLSKGRDIAHDLYVISEIGVNHEGSLAKAKEMIHQISEAGGHAAKFQTYKAEKLTVKNSPAYWDLSKESTRTQYELFKKFDAFNDDDYFELNEECVKVGIDFISTPFDLGAVSMLNEFVRLFKVASADITNVPLLRACALTGKPVVMSTGASTIDEVRFAVETLSASGCEDITLLHCVLNYPTPIEMAELYQIPRLANEFPNCRIGYSDHVVPDSEMKVLTTACLLGARVIEKHFTYDKSIQGNDHYHSMDQSDLANFIARAEDIRLMLGSVLESDRQNELNAVKHARRSVVLSKNMCRGEVLSDLNLIAKRPGEGISPIHWDQLIGRRLKANLLEDHVLAWDDLEPIQ